MVLLTRFIDRVLRKCIGECSCRTRGVKVKAGEKPKTLEQSMSKFRLFLRFLRGSFKDEFGISGAKKLSKPSVLKHDVFGNVYIKNFRTIGQLTIEERDCLSSELVERIGVDDFDLYQKLWKRYIESIEGTYGTGDLIPQNSYTPA